MFQFVTFSISNWHLYSAVRVKYMIDKRQIHVCNVKVTWVEVLQIMQLAVLAIVNELFYGMSYVIVKMKMSLKFFLLPENVRNKILWYKFVSMKM